jgi:hypothetical protein
MGNNPVTDQSFIYIKSDQRDNELRIQAQAIADELRKKDPDVADAFLRNFEYLLNNGDPAVVRFIYLRMIGLICANKKDLQKDNGKDPYYSI